MTNTLSTTIRLVMGAVTLALALTASVVADDAHAKYREEPSCEIDRCY